MTGLEQLEEVIEIQSQSGNWDFDPYMHGFANGLILAYSLLTDTEPQYLDAPETWLSDKEGSSQPTEASL